MEKAECNAFVRSILASVANAHGFVRSRSTWSRATEETTTLLKATPSRWGPTVYLDAGIWIPALLQSNSKSHGDATNASSPSDCPIYIRCSAWSDPRDADLSRALDFDRHDLDHEWRAARIRHHLEKEVMPTLTRCGTLDGLRRAFMLGSFRAGFIDLNARRLLESNE